MPYIEESERIPLDALLQPLTTHLSTLRLGAVNYVITRILLVYFVKITYLTFVMVMGTLVCVGLEYYRRVAIPYEEIKKQENGEVFDV